MRRLSAPAAKVAARAVVRPTSKWPLQLRYALLVGATGLLWTAIYGISLILI